MVLECTQCEALVEALEIANHEYAELDPDGEPICGAKATLVRSPKCNLPSYVPEES
jgi:hypothetical protein